MSHYWTADDPIEARREQVVDWIEDLVEFGAAVVASAVQTWRRTQSRRPTPADIRRLCVEAHTEIREHAQVRALASPDAMDEYARSVGWNNNAERMQAIRRDERRHAEQYEQARRSREEIPARVGSLVHAATALGVKSREYTADELRAGRVALGLEQREEAAE